MNGTPAANRKHIAIFGKTNSGKSSLLNAMVGQDAALVSPTRGTTTDPVKKSMELIPFGPVVFVDTAGLDDTGELGELRVKRSLDVLKYTDFAIYVMDVCDLDEQAYASAKKRFMEYGVPHMLAVNKTDSASEKHLENTRARFKDAIFVSAQTKENIPLLKKELVRRLKEDAVEDTIIGDLIPPGSSVVMVVPIDSEAPKGRIILPQAQLIRDCLDHGIKSLVVRDTELEFALSDLKAVDLVVTDSQAFKRVNEIVPRNIKLTSFSILFARYKGDLETLVKGAYKVDRLEENSRVLISEACTHNHSHEDIGRVKIPGLLDKRTGKKLNYDFKAGYDFPDDLTAYDLVIHCGSCMLTRKAMQARINRCIGQGIEITNYGIVLAYLNGILDRCLEVFK